jgi:L-seryl-tRNA(Ser) seleniumtransferase
MPYNEPMTNFAPGSVKPETLQSEYRKLPAVDAVLRRDAVARLIADYGEEAVTATLRDLLAEARDAIAGGAAAPSASRWPELVAARLAVREQPSLRPVVNATGIIIHTNLGRAPLSDRARQAMDAAAIGYSNLEYALDEGRRGSRHAHARRLLAELTGAEDAMVVNNNAAAVYFVLNALCSGREVLISRGELVEIGGGFRIPDVLRQSGAILAEVGTTNRTHTRDFSQALGAETGAILRVHSSNFRQIGFVAQPGLNELAELLHDWETDTGQRPLLIDDLGSGTLLDTRPFGLAPEPMVQESIAAGADLVTFSGDKLLGGPQAGIIVGRAPLLDALRRHPMARALRVDKLTLAALEATLQSYRRGRALEEIPVWRMIGASAAELEARARHWSEALRAADIDAAVQPGESAVGGGSLPGETLPTFLLALTPQRPEAMAAQLRQRDTPIIGRIQQDRLLFDPRTVRTDQETLLLDALIAASKADSMAGETGNGMRHDG